MRICSVLGNSLPAPEGVAKTIYRAASDRSKRLRYSPYGEVFFLLHAILANKLWQSLVKTMTVVRRFDDIFCCDKHLEIYL